MLKKIILSLLVLSTLFSLCCCLQEEVFSSIQTGETFGHNIDGHQKKLPYNYCLDVNLGSKTRLFKVPDEYLDVPYFTNSVYNTPSIIEGRYIKGYYDNEKIIFCEETDTDIYEYIIFYFATQDISRITDEQSLPYIESNEWFSLCNKIEQ